MAIYNAVQNHYIVNRSASEKDGEQWTTPQQYTSLLKLMVLVAQVNKLYLIKLCNSKGSSTPCHKWWGCTCVTEIRVGQKV